MKYLIILALFISTLLTANAQELKTKSISVFKNGQSFVVKKGTVNTKDKVYTLKELPPALFGTLWFNSGDEITQIISKQVKLKNSIEKKVTNLVELLRANVNQEVTILVGDKSYTGTIKDFGINSNNPNANLYGLTSYMLFKTNDKWLSINPNTVNSVEFLSKPKQKINYKTDSLTARINVNFKSEGNKELEIIYLQNGINWTPTYLLELRSDTEVKLSLQAEVSNSLDNIENIDMNFVVGVPNFQFANQPATLVNLPRLLLPTTSYRKNNQLLASQMLGNNIGYDRDESFKDVTPRDFGFNAQTPEVQNDLYFYTIKNISLENGGSAHYPIFNTKLKAKHLYETVLKPTDLNTYRYQQVGYSFDDKKSEVFHSIEIINSTKYPFTTGSIMIIDEKSRKPVAQSIIKYTPSGQEGYIKVTKAPDVSVKEKENLNKTDESTNYTFNNYHHKEVTLETKITVINSKPTPINFVLRKTIDGTVVKASMKYDKNVSVVANQVNQKESICFETKLKAGEKRIITYTYKAWIRK